MPKGTTSSREIAPGFIERGGLPRLGRGRQRVHRVQHGVAGGDTRSRLSVRPRCGQASTGAGTNFTRPSPIEVECAEAVLGVIEGAEQIKFTKDGSTANTAALKLARAYTGRELVAFCRDHPFFSYDDWFIGKTPMNAGDPRRSPICP